MASTNLPLVPWSKTKLLSARKSSESTLSIQQVALNLFILGRPTLANQLIDALYKHYQGIDFDLTEFETAKCLYDAWKATNTMPSYIAQPDPNFVINGPTSDESRACKKWAEVEDNKIDGLPEHLAKKASKGPLKRKDVGWAVEHLITTDNSDSENTLSVGVAVQVALLAGEKDLAKELVVKNIPQMYSHLIEIWHSLDTARGEQRKWFKDHLGLHYSRQIWSILNSDPSRDAFNIKEDALIEFVNEGCNLIEQRFTQGLHRPYANKTIEELVHLLDESYIAARKANPEAGEHLSILHHGLPTTFLAPGATPQQITALETRLSTTPIGGGANPSKPMLPDGHLPEDYKVFLRTTNGIQTEPKDPSGLFASTDDVGNDAMQGFLDGLEWTLFPCGYTSVTGMDNISLGDFSCLSIGPGGDEGYNILIPPSSVKPALQRFEQVYAGASELHKRVYERAAVDLYGGLEKLRSVEWLCGVWYHWSPEQQLWGGFREYLEVCVGEAVERRRVDERGAEKESESGGKRKRGEGGGVLAGRDVDKEEEGDVGNKRYDLRERKSLRTD